MTQPTTAVAIPDELLNPMTGELIARTDLAAVSSTINDLRELKRNVDAAIAAFSDAAVEESKRVGARTLLADGMKVTISSDKELVWDVEKLADLVAAGLPQERYEQLVTAVVSYKVDGAVARQISGASDTYKAIVEAAKRYEPKRQYVSVNPA